MLVEKRVLRWVVVKDQENDSLAVNWVCLMEMNSLQDRHNSFWQNLKK